uniref:Uncharacterized protein n=1 Tax=Aegilops tauschii subsp. strangulata TaxID=200361 RepID=A0A452YSH0_AEGTS
QGRANPRKLRCVHNTRIRGIRSRFGFGGVELAGPLRELQICNARLLVGSVLVWIRCNGMLMRCAS